MVYRKSWTTFVSNFIGIFIWIGVGIVVLAMRDQWSLTLLQSGWDAGLVRIFFLIILVVITYRIAARVWRFFWLRSFRIVVDDDLVTVRHGILPWNKFQRSWDGDQMHECLMDSNGFTNWLLRTGDLVIVGSEGSTHKYRMTAIGHVAQACGAINLMRRTARKSARGG